MWRVSLSSYKHNPVQLGLSYVDTLPAYFRRVDEYMTCLLTGMLVSSFYILQVRQHYKNSNPFPGSGRGHSKLDHTHVPGFGGQDGFDWILGQE